MAHLLGRLPCRGHGTVDVGRRGLRHVVQVLARGGGMDLVVVFAGPLCPLTCDEKFEVFRHSVTVTRIRARLNGGSVAWPGESPRRSDQTVVRASAQGAGQWGVESVPLLGA